MRRAHLARRVAARAARFFSTDGGDMARTLSRTRSGDGLSRRAHRLKQDHYAGRKAKGSESATTHSVQGVHHVRAVPRGPSASPHLENTMVVGAACFSVFSAG